LSDIKKVFYCVSNIYRVMTDVGNRTLSQCIIKGYCTRRMFDVRLDNISLFTNTHLDDVTQGCFSGSFQLTLTHKILS
jgi:hypothetical protein